MIQFLSTKRKSLGISDLIWWKNMESNWILIVIQPLFSLIATICSYQLISNQANFTYNRPNQCFRHWERSNSSVLSWKLSSEWMQIILSNMKICSMTKENRSSSSLQAHNKSQPQSRREALCKLNLKNPV